MKNRRGGGVFALCAALILGAVLMPVGCAGTAEEKRAQFDATISAVEKQKAAAKAEIDQRIADVKAAFDQQASALKTHITELLAQAAELRATIAAKEAEAQASAGDAERAKRLAEEVARLREEDAQAQKRREAAEKLYAKIETTYNDTAGKFEKITAEIFRHADEKIASLKGERDRLTSEDPGQQIAGGGKVIGDAVGGQAGLLINLGAMVVGGIVSGIYQGRKTAAVKSAAIEAIGTMSQAINSDIMPMSDNAAAVLKAAQSKAARDLVDEADEAYSDTLKIALAAKAPLKAAA